MKVSPLKPDTRSHLGYWKVAGRYFVFDGNGFAVEVKPHRIAQLEMLRKGE